MDPNSIYNTLDKNLYRLSNGISPDPNLSSPNSLDNDLSTVGGRVLPVGLGGNIQGAIDTVAKAGGGEVRLLTGTYNLTTTINMKSNVVLAGSGFGTILDFGGNMAGINVSGNLIYNTGTVSINSGSSILVGSGTTWTSDMVGYTINFGGIPFVIVSVDSSTQITLDSEYYGENVSGGTYVIFDPVSNSILSHFVIQNSGGTGLNGQYVAGEFEAYFINVLGCAKGIVLDYVAFPYLVVTVVGTTAGDAIKVSHSSGMGIEFSSALYTTGGHGLNLNNVFNTGIHDSEFSEASSNGINITSCNNIGVENLTISKNSGKGIEFISNNFEIQVNQVTARRNGSDGIKLTATTDRCIIIESALSNNGGWGVNNAAASNDNNIIVHNTYTGNSSGTVSDSGTGTILDTVKDSDVVFTDITTGNVTSTKHGYAPKSPGDVTKFLNGGPTPGWSTPTGADFLVVQVFS